MKKSEFSLFIVSNPNCAPCLETLLQFGCPFPSLQHWLRLMAAHLLSSVLFCPFFFKVQQTLTHSTLLAPGVPTVHAPCSNLPPLPLESSWISSGSLMPPWGIACLIPRYLQLRSIFPFLCVCWKASIPRPQAISTLNTISNYNLGSEIWGLSRVGQSWAKVKMRESQEEKRQRPREDGGARGSGVHGRQQALCRLPSQLAPRGCPFRCGNPDKLLNYWTSLYLTFLICWIK